jgi:hypothetical protein
MAQNHFPGIVVNGQQLAQELACGTGERCLDMSSGNIVPAKDCPENEVGDGRPALRQGKRFVRIPCMDEIRQELKARYDDAESGSYEDSDELLPQGNRIWNHRVNSLVVVG